MSIINPISMGGGSWNAVANTSASTTSISFPVTHAPSDWLVFRITNLTGISSTSICHIYKKNGTYYDCLVSKNYFYKGGTPTGSYSNGIFTVTRGSSDAFTTTVGDYVLVYI